MDKRTFFSILVFLSIVFVCLLIAKYKNDKLEKDYQTSFGVILGMGNSRNAGNKLFLKYKFVLSGTTYFNNTGLDCNREVEREIADSVVGKKGVVVYQSSNPKNSKILLQRREFEKYNLYLNPADSGLLTILDNMCQ